MQRNFGIIFISLLLGHTVSSAQEVSLSPETATQHLHSLQKLTHLPHSYPLIEEDAHRAKELIPKLILDKYLRYQKLIFPKLSIPLVRCLSEETTGSGYLMADYPHEAICLYLNDLSMLLASLGENENSPLVDYFLIHELAHFVHETSIQGNLANSLSLDGNYSIYRLSDATKAHPENAYALGAASHAEVDRYTYLIFHALDLPVPQALLFRMFNSFMKESEASGFFDQDVALRLKVLNEESALSQAHL